MAIIVTDRIALTVTEIEGRCISACCFHHGCFYAQSVDNCVVVDGVYAQINDCKMCFSSEDAREQLLEAIGELEWAIKREAQHQARAKAISY